MMGKRFTDASKWQDPWFRKLTPTTKVFYLFLLDNVDTAGVWDRDDALFQFLSGSSIVVDAHLEELEGRIVTLADGKILVPKFVKFQNRTTLSQDCPPHRQILRLLEKHGLEQDASGLVIISKGLQKSKQTQGKGLPNPLGIGKGIGKGKGKGDPRGEIPPALDDPRFHEAWDSFHKMRSQHKWPKQKPETLKKMFKDLEAWGLDDAIQALETAVRNGWRGVFHPSQKTKTKVNDRDYEHGTDF